MLWEAQTGENGKAKKVLLPLSVRESTFPGQPAVQNAVVRAGLGAGALEEIRAEAAYSVVTSAPYLSRRDWGC